jgi:hypothetical protein
LFGSTEGEDCRRIDPHFAFMGIARAPVKVCPRNFSASLVTSRGIFRADFPQTNPEIAEFGPLRTALSLDFSGWSIREVRSSNGRFERQEPDGRSKFFRRQIR